MLVLVDRPRPRLGCAWCPALGLSGLGDFVDSLSQAIGRFEGFGVAGSVAQRNNNPGNLRAGPGATGTDAAGYAVFPDLATGWAALRNQIQLNIGRGLSLSEFFGGKPGVYAGYAPAADANNPGQYADVVAGWLSISPSVPLSSYADGGPSPAGVPAGDVGGGDWLASLPSLPALPDLSAGSPYLVVAGVLVAAAVLLLVVRR